MQITFDDPNHRLGLLKSIELWNIKLHVLGQFLLVYIIKVWYSLAPYLERNIWAKNLGGQKKYCKWVESAIIPHDFLHLQL